MSGNNKNKHQKDEESGEQDLKSKLVEASLNNLFGDNKPKEEKVGCCPVLSITFWRKYFNVTQADIGLRLRSALFLTPSFEEVMDGHPDLYGPFWIYTTIIALVSISANVCNYLNNIGNSSTFSYNYDFVPIAASLVIYINIFYTKRHILYKRAQQYQIVYGVGIATPSLLWVIVKLLFKVKIKLIQTICLYGYSETCFIFIIVLSIIPSTILHWCLLAYGFAISTIFFFRNIKREMDELDSNQKYVVFGIVLGCQSILCLMFRFYFFKLTTLNKTS